MVPLLAEHLVENDDREGDDSVNEDRIVQKLPVGKCYQFRWKEIINPLLETAPNSSRHVSSIPQPGQKEPCQSLSQVCFALSIWTS